MLEFLQFTFVSAIWKLSHRLISGSPLLIAGLGSVRCCLQAEVSQEAARAAQPASGEESLSFLGCHTIREQHPNLNVWMLKLQHLKINIISVREANSQKEIRVLFFFQRFLGSTKSTKF